jgi:hypothetical protein
MPDYTVKADVDSMLRADNDAGIRSAIGLGQTDVPTFAGLNSTGIIGNGVFGILPSSSGISYCDSQSTFRIRHAAGSYTQMFNLLPSGEITLGPTAASVTLVPDAAGILAQRNGTAKQVHRVYNTFLGTTANEWGGFDWLTTANTLRIGTEHGGTGAARPIDFVTGGVVRMSINATDATFSVTLKAAALSTYAGTGWILGLDAAYNTGIRFQSFTDSVLVIRNAAATDLARVCLGGTTSAFPAIKRNGTGIDIKLADDSAFAPLTASAVSTGAGATLNPFGDIFALTGRSIGWSSTAARMRSLAADTAGVITLFNSAETGFSRLEFGATNLGISRGTGSPEGVVTALVGSLYLRTDGGAATTLYVKESSPTPSTGWVAK